MVRALGEGVDRFFFGRVGVECARQFRGFENFEQERRELAKFEVAVGGAKRAQETNQSSEAAAIKETDLFELEDEFLCLKDVLFDLELERTGFLASHDAAAAANDDDIPAELRLQLKLHWSTARFAAS